MLWGGVAVEPESWISGRRFGRPSGPLDVDEQEAEKIMASNARQAAAAVVVAAWFHGHIMTRTLARPSGCATLRCERIARMGMGARQAAPAPSVRCILLFIP